MFCFPSISLVCLVSMNCAVGSAKCISGGGEIVCVAIDADFSPFSSRSCADPLVICMVFVCAIICYSCCCISALSFVALGWINTSLNIIMSCSCF